MRYILILLLLVGCSQKEETLNHIKLKLEKIYEEDQSIRKTLDSLNTIYEFDHYLMDSVFTEIKKVDSLHCLEIKPIFEEYGWLDSTQVGKKANSGLFLVLQHAEPSFQKKHMEKMKKAVLSGREDPKRLALLTDRIKTHEGEYQIYGSQLLDFGNGIVGFYPIKNVDKIDSTRASVGLGTISEYSKQFKLEWSIESYYSQSAQLDSILHAFNVPHPSYYEDEK